MKKAYPIIFGVISVLIFVLGVGVYLGKTHTVSFDAIAWKKYPEKIAIQDMNRNGEDGLLVIRLKDGKEQFFAGSFTPKLYADGSMIIFGKDASGVQKIHYVSTNDSISTMEIPDENGRISDAILNPSKSYIIQKFEKDHNSYYCLAEFRISNDPLNCGELSVLGDSDAMWDPKNEHIALIKLNEETYNRIDMWSEEESPIETITQGNNDLFNEISHVFVPTSPSGLQITNLGPWKLISTKEGKSLHMLPGKLSKQTLFDSNHVLYKNDKGLQLYEISSHSLLPILEEKSAQNKSVHFQIKNQTVTF